jgi:hypothetical protein
VQAAAIRGLQDSLVALRGELDEIRRKARDEVDSLRQRLVSRRIPRNFEAILLCCFDPELAGHCPG